MLEINKRDYRYRIENEQFLLAYNVITNKMYFFKGNTKQYIESKLYGAESVELEKKYIDYLISNSILIGDDNNGI